MNKITLLLSFLALGFLTAMGSLNPDNAAVWLSSQNQQMDYLRISIMAMILSLILTNPPRNTLFRYIIGATSVVLISVSLFATYQNMMQVLDGFALLAAGISALVATLEVSIVAEKKAKKQAERVRYLAPAALRLLT